LSSLLSSNKFEFLIGSTHQIIQSCQPEYFTPKELQDIEVSDKSFAGVFAYQVGPLLFRVKRGTQVSADAGKNLDPWLCSG
jgi:hypothetical protein